MKIDFKNYYDFNFSTETYEVSLPPGVYILEAYGASGGSNASSTTARSPVSDGNSPSCIFQNEEVLTLFKGNTQCNFYTSQPGSGAYVKGKLRLSKKTTIYINTGGQGTYGITGINPGGHNGGGNGGKNSGSGGGCTDFRVLGDTLFHRFLVAGSGGGSDNYDQNPNTRSDDGTGGSGGLPGQGMWDAGDYQSKFETNTTHGFSFGYGQDNSTWPERAGAGCGFFGGWAANYHNSGGSGGSSFALSEGIPIPEGEITVKNSAGEFVEKGEYQLTNHTEYYLTEVVFATGVWSGDGKARITFISDNIYCLCNKPETIDTMKNFILIFALSSGLTSIK